MMLRLILLLFGGKKEWYRANSLEGQWLGLHPLTAKGLGQGTKIPQNAYPWPKQKQYNKKENDMENQ